MDVLSSKSDNLLNVGKARSGSFSIQERVQGTNQEAMLGVQKKDVEHSEDGEKGMIVSYIKKVQTKEHADGYWGGVLGKEGQSTMPEYVYLIIWVDGDAIY